jgi:phage terminase large subunit
MRIEAVRRILHKCRFDEKKCEAGIEALGFYHEKKDEQRSVGLGPSHDWSSHAADAFGLMAISYDDPARNANFNRPLNWRRTPLRHTSGPPKLMAPAEASALKESRS